MEYKQIKNGAYNIHLIKTNKFKNIKFNVFFRNELDINSVYKRVFLFDLLTESCMKYKTKRELILKCENLYNASLYSYTEKNGNMLLSSICLDILNPKYTGDDYLNESIELLFDIIFNPNIDDNEFDKNAFNKVMKNHENSINTSKERPSSLAVDNAFNLLKTNSRINLLGDLDLISNITPHNLIETYNEVLKHDYIDIFVIGDIDFDKCIDLINKYAKFNTIKNHKENFYIDNKNKLVTKIDIGDYNQSQIVFIINYNSDNDYEKRYLANIYNVILGGSSLDSILYKKLREDQSLCYNVRSYYKKYDKLGYIITSVSEENIELAIKIIKDSIKSMENVSEDELKRAKTTIKSSLTACMDYPDNIIDYYYFMSLNEIDPFEERIEIFNNIKLDELRKFSKKICIDVIYTLGGKNEKN